MLLFTIHSNATMRAPSEQELKTYCYPGSPMLMSDLCAGMSHAALQPSYMPMSYEQFLQSFGFMGKVDAGGGGYPIPPVGGVVNPPYLPNTWSYMPPMGTVNGSMDRSFNSGLGYEGSIPTMPLKPAHQ